MATVSALNPDLLTNEEAATLLGIKPNTLEIWRTKDKGPEFIKMGETKQSPIRYHIDDIKAWLHSRKFRNTSAYSVAAKQ